MIDCLFETRQDNAQMAASMSEKIAFIKHWRWYRSNWLDVLQQKVKKTKEIDGILNKVLNGVEKGENELVLKAREMFSSTQENDRNIKNGSIVNQNAFQCAKENLEQFYKRCYRVEDAMTQIESDFAEIPDDTMLTNIQPTVIAG